MSAPLCGACGGVLLFSWAAWRYQYNAKRHAACFGRAARSRRCRVILVLGAIVKAAAGLPHSKWGSKDPPLRVRLGGRVIVGLGVDIAEVGRIQAAIERYGETFLRRIYT